MAAPAEAVRARARSLAPRAVREDLGLSRERMARLLDVSTRTVERWEERGELPARDAVRARLAELREVADLGRVVYGGDPFRAFLTVPLPAFEGRSALQVMEAGQADRVLGVLASLYEGQGL